MEEMIRKLPIGIQNFESLRKNSYLYVDKTDYVYKLINTGKQYFLSRPRRFGKSMLLSTFRAYFEGKRELFKGLKIEKLEGDGSDAWQKYPVFYFDFNRDEYKRSNAIEDVLNVHLEKWEELYKVSSEGKSLSARFQILIEKAVELTGKEAVVLVDEYDKPLLEADTEQLEHNKTVFKGFFSTLKSYDEYLKFVFLTGVTKFSKVSIFSDLNQLRDISLTFDYSGICGITEKELEDNFGPEIVIFSDRKGFTKEECLIKLRKMYDGYHFSYESEGVYNPFSLLNALVDCRFDMYWFSTGTPAFLIEKLKNSDVDAKSFTSNKYYADSAELTDYRLENDDPIPLFYQTGYLTIKGYNDEYSRYVLGYPNEEVKYGFLKCLAPYFLCNEKKTNPLDVGKFADDMKEGNTDGIRDRLVELFARIPYPDDEKVVEQNFQNVIYITFMLLGQYVHAEVHNAKGRADCVVETSDYVYIFEFKRDKSAEEALAQIEEQGYAKTYAADKRTVFKIGANFESKERNLSGWMVE
jgi:hypothetical protein